MAGNLREFRSRLREYRWLCESTRYTGEFQVIGLYRYSADLSYLKSLSPPISNPGRQNIFLFDIVITDGTDKQKCLLALSLGHFIEEHKLRIGAFVQINSAKLCYSEGEFNDKHLITYILIEDLQITNRSFTFPTLEQLNFLPSSNPREVSCCPLVTTRKYYLDTWMTMIPIGPEWSRNDYNEWNDTMQRPLTFISLEELHQNWKVIPKPYPAVLVRIVERSKLHHFGYCNKDHPYPFFRELCIADNTACMGIAIFSDLNKGSDSATKPNSILLIEHYSVDERSRLSKFPPVVTNISSLANKVLPFSIMTNKLTKITVIPPNSTVFQAEIAALPIKEYQFIDREHLKNAANGTKVNVIGLVTYVSFSYRIKYKFGNFLSCAWVEMIDKSSYLPFRMLLFVDKDRYSIELKPGKFLMCTNMIVVLPLDDDVYLKSSIFSEFYTTHTSKEYIKHHAVVNVVDIIRRHPDEVAFIRRHMLRQGGIYSFPKLHRQLSLYNDGQDFIPREMIPGAMWSSLLEELGCRERKRVFLSGYIVRVDYVDFETAESEEPVFGWNYADNVKSQQMMYFNVACTSYLQTGLSPLNSSTIEKSTFPLKCAPDCEEELVRYSAHHPSCAEEWRQLDLAKIESLPAFSTGHYVVAIASIHFQSMLQCIFIPEPSTRPHPSFVDLLSGQFEPLRFHQKMTFLGEPPIYTWPEVRQARRTINSVTDKSFVFVVDFFNLGMDKAKCVQLHRAFICPPEQIETFIETLNGNQQNIPNVA